MEVDMQSKFNATGTVEDVVQSLNQQEDLITNVKFVVRQVIHMFNSASTLSVYYQGDMDEESNGGLELKVSNLVMFDEEGNVKEEEYPETPSEGEEKPVEEPMPEPDPEQ